MRKEQSLSVWPLPTVVDDWILLFFSFTLDLSNCSFSYSSFTVECGYTPRNLLSFYNGLYMSKCWRGNIRDKKYFYQQAGLFRERNIFPSAETEWHLLQDSLGKYPQRRCVPQLTFFTTGKCVDPDCGTDLERVLVIGCKRLSIGTRRPMRSKREERARFRTWFEAIRLM